MANTFSSAARLSVIVCNYRPLALRPQVAPGLLLSEKLRNISNSNVKKICVGIPPECWRCIEQSLDFTGYYAEIVPKKVVREGGNAQSQLRISKRRVISYTLDVGEKYTRTPMYANYRVNLQIFNRKSAADVTKMLKIVTARPVTTRRLGQCEGQRRSGAGQAGRGGAAVRSNGCSGKEVEWPGLKSNNRRSSIPGGL